MTDFREAFSIDAVRERFKALGFRPRRGSYGYVTGTGSGSACLLGSFEHMAAKTQGRESRVTVRNGTETLKNLSDLGIPDNILRYLDAGWENSDWLVPFRRQVAPETQDEAESYELGVALGALFIGDDSRVTSDNWENQLDERLAKAGC